MFGFKPSQKAVKQNDEVGNQDVAKLFFDSFSKRVGVMEDGLRQIASDFEKVKLSVDRGKVSDLVLLDRIQNTEGLVRESFASILGALEESYAGARLPTRMPSGKVLGQESSNVRVALGSVAAIASHVTSPTGEVGSLPSITTPTELQVLTLLARAGPKSAPEIGKAVGRSREHMARLMKKLYEEGYILRDQTRIPFRYSVVEKLKHSVGENDSKGEGQEEISVPQA